VALIIGGGLGLAAR